MTQENIRCIFSLVPEITNRTSIDDLIYPNGEILDSKTFQSKVAKILSVITDPDTPPIDVIKAVYFICHKISDIYRLSEDRRKNIAESLSRVIYDSDSLSLPVRLLFLRIKLESVAYATSVNLHGRGIRDKLDYIPYFQILKYMLRSYLIDQYQTEKILKEFANIFDDPTVTWFVKMEIADIHLLNNHKNVGERMLKIIRERHENSSDTTIDDNSNATTGTVYDDNQNVHARDINTSALRACVHLIETVDNCSEYSPEQIGEELKKIDESSVKQIDTVVERVRIDTTRFNFGHNSFSLENVFSALWSYIEKSQYSYELKNRLVEEITAMDVYCSSGHLARLINVIQGYTDDPKLSVTISTYSQMTAVVTSSLNKILSAAPEEISESIISNDRSKFLEYVSDKINDHLMETWKKEYGNICEEVLEAVKHYTGHNYWDLIGNKIVLRQQPNDLGTLACYKIDLNDGIKEECLDHKVVSVSGLEDTEVAAVNKWHCVIS